jgi:hypothetical protein
LGKRCADGYARNIRRAARPHSICLRRLAQFPLAPVISTDKPVVFANACQCFPTGLATFAGLDAFNHTAWIVTTGHAGLRFAVVIAKRESAAFLDAARYLLSIPIVRTYRHNPGDFR